MLVLTRKTDQSILIGDDIEIHIVQVKGSGPGAQVRVGIVAPRGVRILRKEILQAVKEENLRAAQQGTGALPPNQLLSLLAPAVQPADGTPASGAGNHTTSDSDA